MFVMVALCLGENESAMTTEDDKKHQGQSDLQPSYTVSMSFESHKSICSK